MATKSNIKLLAELRKFALRYCGKPPRSVPLGRQLHNAVRLEDPYPLLVEFNKEHKTIHKKTMRSIDRLSTNKKVEPRFVQNLRSRRGLGAVPTIAKVRGKTGKKAKPRIHPSFPKLHSIYGIRMNTLRTRSIMRELLETAKAAFAQLASDIPWYVTKGTLLGGTQGGGWLPDDFDVDVALIPEDENHFWSNVYPGIAVYFSDRGWICVRPYQHLFSVFHAKCPAKAVGPVRHADYWKAAAQACFKQGRGNRDQIMSQCGELKKKKVQVPRRGIIHMDVVVSRLCGREHLDY